ncbi:prolyl oligopeptidase family serine peptidase [Abyssisolibacter fermentans]|uniref:carboxylesterase family protein n=1 Tax=Abyssisolibacter fermentans TaxID=1766203 RepID=UPI00082966DB|nr:prolyl oligopeptidase family serine peptidase [Abyssisolibacter fermentans]
MLEEKRCLNKMINQTMNYLIHLPSDYDALNNRKWPVILFLHGAGERGDNLDDIKKYGIHRYLDEKNLPFVVVSPQCPKDTFWDVHIKELNAIIDEIKEKYDIDSNKIYLVGISMGAFCAWNFAMQQTKLFSAMIVIAGGAMLPKYAYRIKHIPIWVVHGKNDKEVPVEESRKIVTVLKDLGANVKYTEYPNAGHELCTTIFENDEIYKWLLSK